MFAGNKRNFSYPMQAVRFLHLQFTAKRPSVDRHCVNSYPMKLTYSILLLACLSSIEAATYYVATDGNDANEGSKEAPFRTIQRAADLVKKGDTCYIRGGTYRETVTVRNKHGNENQKIRFVAYPNETVRITGLDPISHWEPHKDRTYKAKCDDILQVFVDQEMMLEARWPNTDNNYLQPVFAKMGPLQKVQAQGASAFTDPALDAFPDNFWQGATLWYLPGDQWCATSSPIDAQVDGTLRFINNSRVHELQPREGSPYFIFNTLHALDTAREWYYNKADQHLYFISPDKADPGKHTVEGRTRLNGLLIKSSSHINVTGIHFFAANIHNQWSQHCVIDRCRIEYPVPLFGGFSLPHIRIWKAMRDAAIHWQSSHGIIRNCEIAHSWGAGITVPYGAHENNLIENCLIYDVNWIAGWAAGIHAIGRNHTIRRNTIYDAGRNGIDMKDTIASLCEYNHVARVGWITKDQGSIKTGVTDGEGSIIRYNWLRDQRSAAWCTGVYLDNVSNDYLAHHNVVWDHHNGMRMNMASRVIDAYNNTFVNSSHEDMAQYAPRGAKLTDITTYNNIGTTGHFIGNDIRNNVHGTLEELAFVGPDYGDFRLTEKSIAIDKGLLVAGINDDYQGEAPDAGAYEFGGEDWIPGIEWTPSWNAAPTATFMPLLREGAGRTTITLNAASSGDEDGVIIRYNWDLGDGQNATGKQITHTYDAPGEYTVTLTVRDDLNAIGQHQKSFQF